MEEEEDAEAGIVSSEDDDEEEELQEDEEEEEGVEAEQVDDEEVDSVIGLSVFTNETFARLGELRVVEGGEAELELIDGEGDWEIEEGVPPPALLLKENKAALPEMAAELKEKMWWRWR